MFEYCPGAHNSQFPPEPLMLWPGAHRHVPTELLLRMSQTRPLALSVQISPWPQTQGTPFGVTPSVFSHEALIQSGSASSEHSDVPFELPTSWQNKPVPPITFGVQSIVLAMPTQLQVVGLAKVPLRLGQAGAWLHVLERAVHTMPDSEVHTGRFTLTPVPPQMQEGVVVWGAEPSAGLQACVMGEAHRQEWPLVPQS